MTIYRTADELEGRAIKEIFRRADTIAELHSCLTSIRGNSFRARLLHALEQPMDSAAIDLLRVEAGIQEHGRHLSKLIRFGLIQQEKAEDGERHVRTKLGEEAVNALRELERKIGEDEAAKVYAAALGVNSIRFFLRIYGHKKDPDWEHLQVRYSPAEIGRLSLFLPRTLEGISAIDKMNEVGLLVYTDENYVYMPATRARAFYQYLHELLKIVSVPAPA